MHEYWAARGDNPPLDECLRRVSQADVLVVVVAHRYGWVPAGQPNGERKSITWLECEQAAKEGIEVLAFVVQERHEWPVELKEEYRLIEALQAGKAEAAAGEVQRRVESLKQFREWLRSGCIRTEFTTPEDLRGKVSDALREWRERHPEFARTPAAAAERHADPTKYLEDLRLETAYIDIRGLQVGEGKAHRFPIDELFIPLSGDRPRGGDGGGAPEVGEAGREPLQRSLSRPRLVIVGDPGSGKTTFLRRIAYTLCQTALGVQPQGAETLPGLSECPFPILIRVAELAGYIAHHHPRQSRAGPVAADRPPGSITCWATAAVS